MADRIILEGPKPHALRKFFRDRGISIAMLSKAGGVSHSWVSALLNGYVPWSGPASQWLEDIADQVRAGAVNVR